MAINLTAPTIRPPKAADMFGQQPGAPQTLQTGAATTPTIQPPRAKATPQIEGGGNVAAPQAQQQYRTAPGAFQGQNLSPALENFARSSLATPSRFDIGTVQQGTDLIDKDLAKNAQRSRNDLDEFMSQRGTVGSSVETEGRKDILNDTEDRRMQRLFDLNMALAQTQAADRQTAANIGTQVGGFQRDLGLDQLNEGRYASEFNRLAGRDREDDVRARAGLQLQSGAQQFGQELAGAQFGLSGAELAQRERMQGAELGQRESEASRSFDVENRAQELQRLGMDRANAMAMAQMEQEDRQFGSSMGQRESEFGRSLTEQQSARQQQFGLSREELAQRERMQSTDIGARSQELATQIQAQAAAEGRQITAQQALQQAQIQAQREMQGTDIQARTQQMAQQIQAEAASQGRQITAEQAMQQAQLQTQREMQSRSLGQESQQFGASLAEQQAARLQSLGVTQQQLGLDAQKLVQDAQLQGRSLDLQQAKDQAEVGYRAQALQQEAQLQGRSMGIQEAQIQAERQMQSERLAMQSQQFGAEQSQRESEFARSYGLEGAQFQASQQQFASNMAEQVAGRLQQGGQFAATFQQQGAQMALENGIRQRALDLQQQGMNQEQAFNYAQLSAETGIKQQSVDLQRQGMNQDDAYRYAAMLQDGNFRKEAMSLQAQGMNMDEAFRRAELKFQTQTETARLGLQAQSTADTARLSELDILLRAMSVKDLAADPRMIQRLGDLYKAAQGSSYSPGVISDPSQNYQPANPNRGTGDNPGSDIDANFRSQPGYNQSWGLGWHDGTPDGLAAYAAAGHPGPKGEPGTLDSSGRWVPRT